MRLISWNVQWCRGLDGRVDPARVASEIRRLGDFDVICLQEIADNFPHPRLAGSAGEDQFAWLSALLPAYTLHAAWAVDHPGDAVEAPATPAPTNLRADAATGDPHRRRRFGNAIFSRLPVGPVFRHALPFPHDPGVPWMPRIAIEAVVTAPFGALRVVTTHLEYYSRLQRAAQVAALRAIYTQGHADAGASTSAGDGSPFHSFPPPAAALFCGDFNMPPTDPLFADLLAPFDNGAPRLQDAWGVVHPDRPPPPTFCVHEAYAPGMQPYACDFVFVNEVLSSRVQHMEVDLATRASDHQPVLVTLG